MGEGREASVKHREALTVAVVADGVLVEINLLMTQ
jgi:hypothetical protein